MEATVHYLRTSRPAGEAYFAVGTASFCRQLRQAGFDIRETPDDDVGAVLVGFDTELTYRKVEDACRLLCRGVDFLATNPDLACPTLYGFMPDWRLHLRHAAGRRGPGAPLHRKARPHHDPAWPWNRPGAHSRRR